MGPRMAAQQYLNKHPEALHFRVTLYGSLAATGKGHLTDRAILDVLGEDRTEIVWHPEIVLDFHPNGMRFETISTDGQASGSWLVFSVGGGALAEEGDQLVQSPDIYELDSLLDIKHWCEQRGKS